MSRGVPTPERLAFSLTVLLAAALSTGQTTAPVPRPGQRGGMTFLFHADPKFLEGLRRHELLLDGDGLRLLNTGLDNRPFDEKWGGNELLAEARRCGRPFYIDRLAGGMPYQSLRGLERIANELKGDRRFLGFQLHEWGNSPIHDYQRINTLLGGKSLPITPELLAPLAGRVDAPYLSSGDFSVYETVYRPLASVADVDRYLEEYMHWMAARTSGQIMAVNGYVQLYHTALRLGARNVMPEIGNQVPLTGLQIAWARGAGREHGRPFGVYYEPWGGRPFGCPCALGRSPWFPNSLNPDRQLSGHSIRPELGSSRSLHRRLLYFAWLSGSAWWAEEWGAENYFANWADYPLTEYGRLTKEFRAVASQFGPLEAIVPAALVLPPGAGGVDVRYLFEEADRLYYGLVPADALHEKLRHFSKEVLAARPRRYGADDFNLTPSPWIGCFDVLSADASADLLSKYGLLVCFDAGQAERARAEGRESLLYAGAEGDGQRCTEALRKLTPVLVDGEVGAAYARETGRHLVGVFNNLGVMKVNGKETADPAAARTAVLRGDLKGAEPVVGGQFVVRRGEHQMELRLPAGELAVIALRSRP